MSISSPAGSSGTLPRQQFAPHTHATHNNPSPQGGNGVNILSTVHPPGSSPPGSATTAIAAIGATATIGATTAIVTPSAGQANTVSQPFTNLGAYLPVLPPATIPATADSAAAPGTQSTTTNATNATAASRYMAASGSTSSIVSATMIC